MKFQVSRDGDVLGEHEKGEVIALMKLGVYHPNDHYWTDGMSEWKPLTELILKRRDGVTQRFLTSNWLKWAILGTALLVTAMFAGIWRAGWVSDTVARHTSAQTYADLHSKVPADFLLTKDTLPQLEKWADEGDAIAQALAADCYTNEWFIVERDESKARHWLEKSVEQGCALGVVIKSAGALLSGATAPRVLYHPIEGRLSEPDGNLSGLITLDDDGPHGIQSSARDTLIRIADSSPSALKRHLGLTFALGSGGKKALDQAVTWLERAARDGDVTSMIWIAHHYEKNTSKEAARTWFKKASEAGDPRGIALYGWYLGNGIGGGQDKEAARHLFNGLQDAASPVLALVAYMARDGVGGLEQDTDTIIWSRRAAESGDPLWMTYWGFLLASGGGVRADGSKGVEWLKRAEGMGYEGASLELALIYFQGKGVARDPESAVKHLHHYVDMGTSERSVIIRRAYMAANWADIFARSRFGSLGLPCVREALPFYRMAAELGDIPSIIEVAEAYQSSDYMPRSDREAFAWWLRAANLGNARAMGEVGSAYMDGIAVPKDHIEAYGWLNLARASGEALLSKWNAASLEVWMPADQIVAGQQRSRELTQMIETRKQEHEKFSSGDAKPSKIIPGSSGVTGTGFFVSNEGHFLTNVHVIDKASSIKVRLPNQTTASAHLIRKDAANDLALLQLDGDSPQSIGLTVQSVGEEVGTPVFTIGFPNVLVQGIEPKMTEGSISSTSGIQDDPRFYQISVPIQPGNSGGPLLNEEGEVIGIVQSRLSTKAALAAGAGLPQNVNYALKASLALPLLDGVSTVKEDSTNSKSLQATASRVKKSVVLIMAE